LRGRRVLTTKIHEVTRNGDLARDFGLSGPMQRAAVSITSNIAEGYERKSPKDFQRFLMFAKTSCAELRSQCYVALDIGALTQTQFDELLAQTGEIGRIIAGLHSSVS
jgi:four helix bundle protein